MARLIIRFVHDERGGSTSPQAKVLPEVCAPLVIDSDKVTDLLARELRDDLDADLTLGHTGPDTSALRVSSPYVLDPEAPEVSTITVRPFGTRASSTYLLDAVPVVERSVRSQLRDRWDISVD
ncbi:MAG TPA: hypothetical protein VLE99_02695 [Candidatus Saccharimonadales bacterium]|nr:hypothetical protein [Candidatus Saccharimonadales bacterium]